MNIIRKMQRNNLMLWFLAITIGLRALIATGFMLETNGDGPFGLAIVLCDGMSGTALPDAGTDPHAVHKHHDNSTSDQDATAGLTGNTCGLWSTSSTFVQVIALASDLPDTTGRDPYVQYSRPLAAVLFYQQPQQPRAPPVSRIS